MLCNQRFLLCEHSFTFIVKNIWKCLLESKGEISLLPVLDLLVFYFKQVFRFWLFFLLFLHKISFKGELRPKFYFCFFVFFVKFIKAVPFTMFYGVLNIHLKVMKLRSSERLDVTSYLRMFIMLFSAVHDVLEQKFIWFEGLENTFPFPCFFFRFCTLYVHCICWQFWFMMSKSAKL